MWSGQQEGSRPFSTLAPQDRGQPRTITPQLADLIERLKRENPHRTGATLLRELTLTAGKDTDGISASIRIRDPWCGGENRRFHRVSQRRKH